MHVEYDVALQPGDRGGLRVCKRDREHCRQYKLPSARAHACACVMCWLGCSDIERTIDHLDETARFLREETAFLNERQISIRARIPGVLPP